MRMRSATAKAAATGELIWRGLVQLGDEPGVFDNASYAGLAFELPITLSHFDPNNPQPARFDIVVESEEVQTFQGYSGHRVEIVAWSDSGGAWQGSIIGEGRLSSSDTPLVVSAQGDDKVRFISLRVRINTDLAPGLYDDFLLTKVSLVATAHYADLGFRYG